MPLPKPAITAWSVVRLVMAAAIVAAVVAQFSASLTRAGERGDDVITVATNFFSFFTILSNSLSAIVLVLAAVWYFARGRRVASPVEPRGIAVALAAASTYMIITGIVYNVLLRGVTLPQGSEPIPWSNEILHLVAPLFFVADVLVGAARRRLPWSSVAAVLVFPIVWVIYTMVRGPLITNPVSGDPYWYPYPFLNPNNFADGYVTVALYIVGIAVAVLIVAAAVVAAGRWRGADAATPAPTGDQDEARTGPY